MALIDNEQRLKATDPFTSFIVQAPAGSGKTEILTQRYLRLLSTVKAPEQILALTFTKKAASEMRNRIVVALQLAASKVEAKSAHQQRTLDYANLALAHNETLGWNLLQLPNRLKIITIDALCQQINQAIPLVEKQIPYSNITDKAQAYYLKAGRACIEYAIENQEYQEAIKTLLLHVDNRQDRLLELFSTLLAQRDQWLLPLFKAKSQSKSHFEKALQLIEHHALLRFKQSLPRSLFDEVITLARDMANIENNPLSPRFSLQQWQTLEDTSQELTTALASLLLTKELAFRNAFDHHVGLKKDLCSKEDYERIKTASKELLEQLREFPDFLTMLTEVSRLPPPHYDLEQWEVLQALFVLLPLLVGHLHLLFSEHNEVDFTAISQFALRALGPAEEPTDLALYLDNTIHHLLVDEFQDTSMSQFELLTQLVQGWQAQEGKTLFIVGDPMQSIYRFRQAEVGLFFRAKTQGIGPVALNFLELRCNFRSNEVLVNWVNQQFSCLFPKEPDAESGAVPFHPSTAVIEPSKDSAIQALSFSSKQQEANALIELIKQELKERPDQSIAILVRSRTHLTDIITLLRQHQIPYLGTDIDLLANLPHLADAWSLTQALLEPANRLAWLSLLRSPYCGLSLEDLHTIASSDTKHSIYANLLRLESMTTLSDEGRLRAQFFINVMHHALVQRYQTKLSDWVAQTLKALHVEQCLNDLQKKDLDQFLELLDKYDSEGGLADKNEFQKELNSLYSKQSTPSKLQVMTIHKSKGLEFDTVFLPSLGAQPNRGDSPMLRWLNLPTEDKDNLLLVSPIRAAHQGSCALYDYLTRLDEEKSGYEAQRLLYVAVTRAKSRLFLLDGSTKSSKASFLHLLKQQEFTKIETESELLLANTALPQLTRLPLAFYNHQKKSALGFINAPAAKLSTDLSRLIGIVAHQLLHWICDYHPNSLEDIPWEMAKKALRQLGFDTKTQAFAFEILQQQITAFYLDPKGAWIMAKHTNEYNEYELLVTHLEQLVTRIIDRTFEDQDTLWIIDFKTGKMDEEAVLKHQQQLNEYAYHLSSRTSLSIRCGLYYLALTQWVEWGYDKKMALHQEDCIQDFHDS